MTDIELNNINLIIKYYDAVINSKLYIKYNVNYRLYSRLMYNSLSEIPEGMIKIYLDRKNKNNYEIIEIKKAHKFIKLQGFV